MPRAEQCVPPSASLRPESLRGRMFFGEGRFHLGLLLPGVSSRGGFARLHHPVDIAFEIPLAGSQVVFSFSFMASEFMVTPLSLQNAPNPQKQASNRTNLLRKPHGTPLPFFLCTKKTDNSAGCRRSNGRRTRRLSLRPSGYEPTSCQLLHPAIYRWLIAIYRFCVMQR